MTKFKNIRDFEKLSSAEEVIMKAIWDNGKEDIRLLQLISNLKENYGRDYARTTVVTFIGKMAAKGYVTTYKIGKFSYVKALVTEEAFKKDLLIRICEFWFAGDKDKMIEAANHMYEK